MAEQDNEFYDKNIVITGASSGIGRSAAIYFLNCGANVVLAGQDKDSMLNMCNENGFKNGTIMQFDLIDDQTIFDFKTAIVESLNKVDIIIVSHGILLDGDVEKSYPQDVDYSLDINLRSVYLLIKYLSPFLNEGASIINISCLYGSRPCTGMIGQAMSKAGLESLTRYLAGELSSYDIRVNAITSCPLDTNALRRIDCSDAEINLLKQKMEKNVPMGRIGKPDDIVRAIIFLASRKSKCITGQIIRVDGGRGLTSSGYVHYRGIKNMNARFEADGVRIGSWFSEMKRKYIGEKSITHIEDLKQATKLVEETIKESNFSTNLSDAHLDINAGYKYVDTNDEKLKNKFINRNYKPGIDPSEISSNQNIQNDNSNFNDLNGMEILSEEPKKKNAENFNTFLNEKEIPTKNDDENKLPSEKSQDNKESIFINNKKTELNNPPFIEENLKKNKIDNFNNEIDPNNSKNHLEKNSEESIQKSDD